MLGTGAVAQILTADEPIKVSLKKLPARKAMIAKMLEFESVLGSMPGAKFGDDACPLKHTFADGLYIRQMTAPEGMLNVSKIHKTTHPYFILKGEFSVLTENGLIRIKAPHTGITKAGTKRIVYFHAETVWITVHATNETDLERIEEEIMAKSYEELPENIREILCHG